VTFRDKERTSEEGKQEKEEDLHGVKSLKSLRKGESLAS